MNNISQLISELKNGWDVVTLLPEIIVEYNGNYMTIKDLNLVMVTCKYPLPSVLRLLINNFHNEINESINIKFSEGKSALHYAC